MRINEVRMKEDKKNSIYCPIEYGLQVFGGKWKARVICVLNDKGTLRYNQLREDMPEITDGMLASTLKELMQENIVERKQYGEIPPRVEYSLTPKGESTIPILDIIRKWSMEQFKIEAKGNLAAAQKRLEEAVKADRTGCLVNAGIKANKEMPIKEEV